MESMIKGRTLSGHSNATLTVTDLKNQKDRVQVTIQMHHADPVVIIVDRAEFKRIQKA